MTTATTDAPDRERLLDDLVVAYLEAVEDGAAPDRGQWLARYADMAGELEELFADLDKVMGWTAPLRDAVTPPVSGTRPAAPPPRSRPCLRVVGDYELLEEIARGGMGVVYRARQTSLQRTVAVKMVLAGAAASPADLKRLRAEAEAAALLDHPNIVPIYEVGEEDGRPYFSMKLIEGGTLQQHLGRFAASPREAARLVATVARAVHHAHQRGVLHRDLKPANSRRAPAATGGRAPPGGPPPPGGARPPFAGYEPHVSDFGLAKRVEGASSLTQPGAVVGTPSYMAPEQARGQRGLTTAADVYALGAVLYAVLTGRPPFQGATPLETLLALLEQDPPQPRAVNPAVDRDLETICLKCLEKDPRRRYGSAEALADDLDRWLRGEPIRARPCGPVRRLVKWARRRPAVAALAAALVLAGAGLAAGGVHYLDQRARALEKELDDRRRADGLRDEVRRLLLRAQEALTGGDLPDAQRHLAAAAGRVAAEPALADLAEPIRRLRVEADRRAVLRADRRKAADKLRQFQRLRDDALFHGAQFTGVDLPANLRATRGAATEALALFGAAPGSPRPVLDAALTEAEKRAAADGCYELLVLLAEVVARDDPKQGPRQALAVLDRAVRLGPPTRAYHERRARYLKQAGDATGASAEADRAKALQPSRALDHFLLGEDLRRRGEAGAAARAFEVALGAQPDHFWARYFLAVCSLESNPRLAKECLTTCAGQRPDLVWVYLLRAIAHDKLNEPEAAEADFRRAEAKADDEARYALLVNRGSLRSRQGDRVADGLDDLRRAVALRPGKYQAHANLANLHEKQERFDDALAHLDRAVGAASALHRAGELEAATLARLHHDRARVRWKREDFDAALRDFDEAIRLHARPQDHVERGRLLHVRKRYDEAVAAFDAALAGPTPAVPPAHPDYQAHVAACRWRAEALLRLAEAETSPAARRRHYEQALRSLDAYRARGGRRLADVHQARGLIRAALGDRPAAVDEYTQALALKPDALTYACRGWVHLASDAVELASRDFEEAIRLDRASGDAHNGRGYVRLRRGQLAEAVREAREAVRLGPPSPRLLWHAARVCALAAGRAGPVAEEYRGHALRLLRAALDAVPAGERRGFWQANVLHEAAFESIRRTPAFARLAPDL